MIRIINNTYFRGSRSADDVHSTMPAKLLEEFENNLHTRDVYGDWRTTCLPNPKRFSNFVTEHFGGTHRKARHA